MGKKENPTRIKPVSDDELPPEFKKFDKPFGIEQHEFNIIFFLLTHPFAVIYILYMLPFGVVPIWSFIHAIFYGYLSGIGITLGCHRYWTHRTYKAAKPLQYMLMLVQTISMQYPIFKWCRDHRVHHKYTDTNADPHSAARGFWFSHITWLFFPKHPDLVAALKVVDISDLARDPVVRFQSKYYWELFVVVFYIIPMGALVFLFPEMTWFQIHCCNMSRYVLSLHFTFLVNSVAHKWGDKPYDKYITAVENKWVSLFAVGEGWHNYHHTFSWDYKTAELGFYYNFSTVLIHFFAKIGWAYDMKTVSHKLLLDRINRTGDGSHPLHGENHKVNLHDDYINKSRLVWGWGDDQVRKEDLEITETLFPSKSR